MSLAPSLRLLKQLALLLALLGLFWLGYQARRGWQFQHLFAPKRIVENFRGMDKLFHSNPIRKPGTIYNLAGAPQALPKDFSFDNKQLSIRDWISQSGTTGLVVMANGKLAFEEYYQGNDASTQVIS